MSGRDYTWIWSAQHGDYYRWNTNPDGTRELEWARNTLPPPASAAPQFQNTHNPPPTQPAHYPQHSQQNQQSTPAQLPSGQFYPAAPPVSQSYGQNPYNQYQSTPQPPSSSQQSDRTTGRGSMGSSGGYQSHTPQSSDDYSKGWSRQS